MQASGISKALLEREALSLYVGGTYPRKEVKPPFGRFYEIKKRVSARASTAFTLFYYLYIRFASVTSLLGAFLVITHILQLPGAWA